jgi:anthranilate synthase/aminodeoxychorismate synthase-like glutamine amidotransferase
MILLIDNYDSFVFNLARYFEELGVETEVVRNDAISVADVIARSPRAVVLSPGPCTPQEAGVCEDLVRAAIGTLPILGVCLGHQAIVTALGGTLARAPQPVHGRFSPIRHTGERLFANLPNPLQVARYHSLIAERDRLPQSLNVTAETDDGIVMAIRHAVHPVFGVQFHPESVLTEHGYALLAAFLRMAGLVAREPPNNERTERPPDSPIVRADWPAHPITF